MTVRAERAGSTVVLHLEGPGARLTVEEDTRELHERVWAITRASPCNVVLDLGGLRQIDCSGIGQLVQLHERVCETGGLFSLANVERRQKLLLQILGLLRLFPVFDSRDEAITACWSALARDCIPRRPRLYPPLQRSAEGALEPTA
jgi:anti-anti-sigma factor